MYIWTKHASAELRASGHEYMFGHWILDLLPPPAAIEKP